MTQLCSKFDYSTLDVDTAKFLLQKEENMRDIVKDVYPRLGKELKEAQDELAKRGYGCFEQWYESLGFKRQSVYNYINAYSFLQLLEEQKKESLAEQLPANLLYVAGRKNAHPEAVQAVIDGKVTSLEDYKALEKKLREAEQRAERAENEARHWQGVARSAQNQQPRVVTQTVQVVPDDYEQLQRDVKELSTENIQLKRAINEIHEQYQEKMSHEDKRKAVNKDLKRYCTELIQQTALYTESILYNLSLNLGDREAMQLIESFHVQYSHDIQMFFTKLKEMTTIRVVK